MDLILDLSDHMESVERWREWLATLRALPPNTDGVAREIALVEKWIPKRIELEKELKARKAA
jgi:hypothetical protein